ncbi:MAG: hypothetical protein N2C14_28335 [Planctomycetales bacterium]
MQDEYDQNPDKLDPEPLDLLWVRHDPQTITTEQLLTTVREQGFEGSIRE